MMPFEGNIYIRAHCLKTNFFHPTFCTSHLSLQRALFLDGLSAYRPSD
jgi:hypothetical protein